MAGSHGSGEVKYADYLEGMHWNLVGWATKEEDRSYLNDTVPEIINGAIENNPWTDVDAYNPNAAVALVDNSPLGKQYDLLVGLATLTSGLTRALSETTDFNTILANAETKAAATFSAVDTDVDNAESIARDQADELLTALRSAGRVEATALGAAAKTSANMHLSGLVTAAVAAADAAVDSSIEDLVDAYEEDIKPAYMRSLNRFTGMMADIGAVQSSAFVQGIATLEASFMRDVNKYSAERRHDTTSRLIESYMNLYRDFVGQYAQNASEQVKSQLSAYQTDYANFLQMYIANESDRNTFRLQAVREMDQLLTMLVGAKQDSIGRYTDFYTKLIIALKEQADRQAELDGLESRWPIELTMYQGNAIAAIAGTASMIDKPTSGTASALSGALSGASALASTGPYGMAAGAILGGIGGMF